MPTTRQSIHGARLCVRNLTVMALLARVSASMGDDTRGKSLTLAVLQGLVDRTSFVNALDDVVMVAAAFTLTALVPVVSFKKSVGPRTRGTAVEG